MRVSHPPSRLSPPPGASMTDLFAAAGNDPQTDVSSPVPSKRKGEDDKVPKRGYRACVRFFGSINQDKQLMSGPLPTAKSKM